MCMLVRQVMIFVTLILLVIQPTATLAKEDAPNGVVDGVSGCLMLVKREVFEAIGLLDEDYFFSFEDLDFCLEKFGKVGKEMGILK